jgi:RNA polymerase sigma factor (sigma-70 family)
MSEHRDEEDADDIRRVLAGEGSAYGGLVSRHARRVHDLARRMLRDAHEAEDVTQQAFLNAYKALGRFDLARPFRHWLLRITSNLCRNRLAARKVRQKELAARGKDELLPALPAPPRDAETEASPAWTPSVRAALEALPERYRLPMLLRYQQDCTLGEISEITGIALATIKTHLHRGRAALRAGLTPPETETGTGGTKE